MRPGLIARVYTSRSGLLCSMVCLHWLFQALTLGMRGKESRSREKWPEWVNQPADTEKPHWELTIPWTLSQQDGLVPVGVLAVM